jgi:hypothetical protein
VIRTDNAANVAAVAKGACENPLVMRMIRLLIADQIKEDFSVRLIYIPTDLNTDADALSRGDADTVTRHILGATLLTPAFPRELPALAVKWTPR